MRCIYKPIKEWLTDRLIEEKLTRQSGEKVVIINKEVADVKGMLPLQTNTHKRFGLQICIYQVQQTYLGAGGGAVGQQQGIYNQEVHPWFGGAASLAKEPLNKHLQMQWFLFYGQQHKWPCDPCGIEIGGRCLEIHANPAPAAY